MSSTMKLRTLDPTANEDEWMGILANSPHDFYHLPGYLSMSSESDERAVGFEIYEGNNSFFLPLVLRPIPQTQLWDATSPYGYPGPIVRVSAARELPKFMERAAETLVNELSQRRIITCFVRLHPLLMQNAESLGKFGLLQHHGSTVSVDLTLDERAISLGMRSGHRSEIRQARRRGQRPYIDESWNHFDDFCEIYKETMDRLGAHPSYYFSREYYDELRHALGSRLHLGVVEIGGRIASAGLFTETCGLVQYHLSGTRNVFMRDRPTKVLLDEVIAWAKARGNQDFHLGGGVGGENDSLFRFKAGFSKRHHVFYTWRVVTDKIAYEELINTRIQSVNPDNLSGFFPAYRKLTT